MQIFQHAAQIISKARSAVAVTGAGISVESGIPPFRGASGLWKKFDPMKYAHIDAFKKDPETVWQVLLKDMKQVLDKARPNAGHQSLYHLETMGILKTIITQNVDGLHQQAGSRDVIEFHGSFASHRCMVCGQPFNSKTLSLNEIPPRCFCGGILRPNVIMFGEMIPPDDMQRAQMLAASCDVMLLVGTSATVQPAAYLPVIAKRSGAAIVEINTEPTPLTHQISDVTLIGKAGQTMQTLLTVVDELSR